MLAWTPHDLRHCRTRRGEVLGESGNGLLCEHDIRSVNARERAAVKAMHLFGGGVDAPYRLEAELEALRL